MSLCEYPFDHLPVNVGQPEITAIISIRQFLMIESELPKDRCVQIVNMDFVLDCPRAELVSRAISRPAFDAAAGQPHAKRPAIMISARGSPLHISIGGR